MKYSILGVIFSYIIKIIIVFTCCFNLYTANAQTTLLDKKISITFNNETFPNALTKLETQLNCIFSYTPTLIKVDKRIDKIFTNISLREILNDILKADKISYRQRNDIIYLQATPKKINIEERKVYGEIKTINGNSIPFVSVVLLGTRYGTSSNENGNFIIKNIPEGIYTIKTGAIGFYTDTQTIEVVNKDISLNIILKEKVEALDNIVISGKTTATKQEEKAITINSVDLKQLRNQALGTEEALKTTTGLVVRQNGGLGSAVNINLNGLTGRSVRTYYDGIPIEVYGNGIDLNTIPVDALERVDVYKGVMPIDVGTDALGGGINLVPLKQSKEYLRTSYSFGSFNTHRGTFNGLKKINKKVSLSTISYFNYSDNDYKMRNILNQVELPSGLGVKDEIIDVKRFHNQHISGFIEARLRIKNLKWADRLEFASSYSGRKDEIQHGRSIIQTSIGEAEVKTNGFVQRIDYRKTFFKDKLQTRYFGVLSSAVDKVNDSTSNVYNWRGEISTLITGKSEVFADPTLLKRKSLGTAHRLTLNYKITDQINFKISDFYKYTRIKGEDPLKELELINNELIDLNTIPSFIHQNIFGAGLDALFLEDKLNAIAFFKNYTYKAESIDAERVDVGILPIIEIQNNTNGYGFALKYQIDPTIFIRTSFEQAIRIPTELEIFGNLGTIAPNYELKPEESLNWNVGAQFEKRFKNEKSISLSINGFIRDRKNLIRAIPISTDRVKFINEALVNGKGVELSMNVIPLKNLSLKGNFTFQSNKIEDTDNRFSGEQPINVGFEVPNIPLKFYNLKANYTIENIFKSENNLQFSWTYLFTDKFSINTVSDIDTATDDFFVPKQNIHNAGLTYIMKEKGLAFSFNLQNVFNTEVFDNFRIPRPGINYAFKINYSL